MKSSQLNHDQTRMKHLSDFLIQSTMLGIRWDQDRGLNLKGKETSAQVSIV